MKKVFERANDLHVRCTYVFKNSADDYAYADATHTTKFSADALHDLFLKGMVIVDADVEYKPIICEVDDGVCIITYVKADTTTPTTAVLETIVSKEFSA